ncbi:MAG: carbon storage regulator CsrA [Synergistaceae bacterium]|nr:carbon storage regulator CsrA [Synergistaceae bacterium]
MLVLSRRLGEAIQIGDDIEVIVADIRGEMVRLGIKAPKKTQIWRKELWDAIVAENIAAAGASKEIVVTPKIPVSVFSKLSNLKTVKGKE